VGSSNAVVTIAYATLAPHLPQIGRQQLNNSPSLDWTGVSQA
jgi:hypothetical protein